MQEDPSPIPLELQQPFAAYPPYQSQAQASVPYPAQADVSAPSSQSTRKFTLKYGLIFGAILIGCYILAIASARILVNILLMNYHSSLYTIGLYGLFSTAIFTLICWGVYFCAGIFTVRRTQRVGTTNITNLWASLCYFVAYCLFVTYDLLFPFRENHVAPATALYSISVTFALVLLQTGMGIGIGTLGGLLEQNRARKIASHPPVYKQQIISNPLEL